MSQTRIVEVRAGILKKNDELARALRERFERAGVFVVNLVSSPGTGKTELLERRSPLLVQHGRARRRRWSETWRRTTMRSDWRGAVLRRARSTRTGAATSKPR